MKNFLKRIVLFLLKRMAKRYMRKFKGKVISVTGSIGKTSTKEAIFTVLNSKFKVLKSKGNMNTEFGLPLTILGIESGHSSAVKWTWLLIKGFFNSISKNLNEVVLVELGVEQPKDMDYLLKIIKPDIAVVTNITPVHMAEGQFKDLEEIFSEKRKAVDALKEDGVAVLNTDNPYLEMLKKERKRKGTIGYGIGADADYKVSGVSLSIEGVDFVLKKEDKKYKIHVNVLGEYQVYTVLPAIICGELMGMEMDEILNALERYRLPPGRMSIIAGLNDSIILDGSYNASPEAMKSALKLLGALGERKRRIAVLGSMNDLGEKSQELHEIIGKIVPECADLLVTVGSEAKYYASKAKESGMNEKNIHSCRTSTEAGEVLKDEIKESDLILVKGSQNNIRLEKCVKILMKHPEDAAKLLVRQGTGWRQGRNIHKNNYA